MQTHLYQYYNNHSELYKKNNTSKRRHKRHIFVNVTIKMMQGPAITPHPFISKCHCLSMADYSVKCPREIVILIIG